MTPADLQAYALALMASKMTGATVEEVIEDAENYWRGRNPVAKRSKTTFTPSNEDVMEIYELYPSKDIYNRNRSTNKGSRDKEKIRSLLSFTPKEKVRTAIQDYVKQHQETQTYLQNFSTMLNNLDLDTEPLLLEPKVDNDDYYR